MEIDPLYVDVAVRRWQRYTGKPARLDGSGATFEDIAEQRSMSSQIVANCSTKQQNG
jgi:DNA modification methylase